MKKFNAVFLAAMLSFCTVTVVTPPKAEAFDWFSVAARAVVASHQKAAIVESLEYYDGEGRDKLMEELKEQNGVNYDPTANAMLERIMTNMSAGIAKSDATIIEKPYRYFVNNDKSFNAFCALGHNVSVNIGAFEFVNYNEEMLAAIIAHEMVHGQKNHSLNGAKKKLSVDVVLASVGGELGVGSIIAANVVAAHAKNSGITKKNEWEADNISFEYMANAGYNVGACAAVWQQVLEQQNHRSNILQDILAPSTHPSPDDRRDNFAKKMYEYSNKKVKVDEKTGAILVNGKEFTIPAATNTMSSKQRAYYLAGNLAEMYHKGQEKSNAYVRDNVVYVGNIGIMSALNGDKSAAALATKLNSIK